MTNLDIFFIAFMVAAIGVLYVCTVLQRVNYKVIIRSIKIHFDSLKRGIGI